jgi:hypothetical protein
MTFLPSVIRAEYRGGFRIRITFNDLSERTVDFGPWLKGPVFEALKDPAYFREFFVDGGTVAERGRYRTRNSLRGCILAANPWQAPAADHGSCARPASQGAGSSLRSSLISTAND